MRSAVLINVDKVQRKERPDEGRDQDGGDPGQRPAAESEPETSRSPGGW